MTSSAFVLRRRAARWLLQIGVSRRDPRFRDYLAAAASFLIREQAHHLRMRELADRLRDGSSLQTGLPFSEAIYVARALDSPPPIDPSDSFLNGLAMLARNEPLIEMGRRFSATQAEKARAGAAAKWKGREPLKEIIRSLAKQRDALGDPLDPILLWPKLWSELDALGLAPEELEDPPRYVFGNESINYEAFRTRVRRYRNSE